MEAKTAHDFVVTGYFEHILSNYSDDECLKLTCVFSSFCHSLLTFPCFISFSTSLYIYYYFFFSFIDQMYTSVTMFY